MARAEAEWVAQGALGSERPLRLLRWIALSTPLAVRDPVLWLLTLVLVALPYRAANAASARYLHRLTGRAPSFAERHRHALTFARVTLDRARLLTEAAETYSIVSDGEEAVLRHLRAGRGGVLLSGHFGSFEALRALDRRLPELKVRYLMYTRHSPALQAVLSELNPEVARRVIPLDDGPAAMIEAVAALKRGEFVAILGDRMPHTTTRGRLTTEFLGGSITVPSSPYVLAMGAGAPLILCFAPWLGRDTYRVDFSEIYDGTAVPRAERGARIQRLAQLYTSRLETLCRRHPFNWFNFFDIWRIERDLPSADARHGHGGA